MSRIILQFSTTNRLLDSSALVSACKGMSGIHRACGYVAGLVYLVSTPENRTIPGGAYIG
jgi:hypothetical protein